MVAKITAKRLRWGACLAILFVFIYRPIIRHGHQIAIPVWTATLSASIGFIGVYMAAHPPEPKETGKKWFYKITFIILAFGIVILTWRQTSIDAKEKDAIFQSHSNELYLVQNQLSNDDSKITSLQKILISNSSPAIGGLILADQMEKVSQDEIKIMQDQKVISESPTTLQSMRSERANRQEIDRLSKMHDELQEERAQLQAKEEEKQAEIKRISDQEKQHQETLLIEQNITDECLDIFDYAVGNLYELLSDLKRDTGDNVFFNMPAPPTVSKSSLVFKGKIIEGTNYIRLGTNSGWTFNIITERQKTLDPNVHGYKTAYRINVLNTLHISGLAKTGESVLTIQSSFSRFRSSRGQLRTNESTSIVLRV